MIAIITLVINLWGVSDSNPTQLEYLMTVGLREGVQLEQQISKRGLVIGLALAILCAVINLVLRTVVQIQKASVPLPEQQQQQQRESRIESSIASTHGQPCLNPENAISNSITVILPFGIYVTIALFSVFGIFMGFQTIDRNNHFHLAPINAGTFTLCNLLPSVFILSDKNVKAFIRKKMQQGLQQFLSIRFFISNQIVPA